MSSNPNSIHVTRHKDGRVLPVEIRPADQSWILFIDNKGRPSLWLDFPGCVPVDEKDEARGFLEHAYMPAQVAYGPEPERMTDYERDALEFAKTGDPDLAP